MPYNCESLAEIKTMVKSQLKLLGAFVDEELPDYIMVMVANKKKRDSMNNDLQLFLGNQTEKFTEWLHQSLESYNNPEKKPGTITGSPIEKKKKISTVDKITKTVDKKISRHVSRSSKEHRSRSRSPLVLKDSLSFSSFVNTDPDMISVRTDENEFIEEIASINSLDSTSNAPVSKHKEHRRIVSTSSLPGKCDPQTDDEMPGLRSLVKISTHVPISSTVPPHMRPVGLLLKRAMNEAQANLKSPSKIIPPTTSANQSMRPAAVVRGRKRPAEEPLQNLNSGDEDEFPKAKSTRFVVTLNESDNLSNISSAVSNVKSRLGPRVSKVLDLASCTGNSVNDDAHSIDVRDILIAKKLKKSQQLFSNEVSTQHKKKRIIAEQLKKILPMVINLNDTDEDEALLSGENVPSTTSLNKQESSIAPAPKRENIPSTLERCKYWPSCRNGPSCQFIHPKEECKSFPHCQFGESCLYLHPACKFSSSCSRVNCPFSHAGQHPNQAPQVAGVITCRFVPNCKNASCPFYHPLGPVVNTVATTVSKVCRFGSSCANRTTCPFSHPKSHANAKTRIPATHKLKWIAPGKPNLSKTVMDSTISLGNHLEASNIVV